VQDYGEIDIQIFEKEFGKLQTNKVILTNERDEHIKEQHPQDYEYFKRYASETIHKPDEILRDFKNDGTVFMVKKLPDTNLNVVIRLALETDKPELKNSIMTFYRIRESNLKKLRNNNKTLYKRQ